MSIQCDQMLELKVTQTLLKVAEYLGIFYKKICYQLL